MNKRARSVPELTALLAVVGAATVALGIVPMQFLVIGIRALGASAGWWPGEATDDDGESGFATAIGAIGIGLLTVLAVSTAAFIGARWEHRTPRLALTFFCALLLAWVIVWLVQFWSSGAQWNPWV